MVFENSSKFLKIAVVVLLVANVFNMVSFSTNGWAQIQEKNSTDNNYTDFGLWQACNCHCIQPENSANMFSSNFTPFYRATQAMMTIGFILLVVCFFMVLLSMIIFVMQRTIIIKFVILGIAIASVVFFTIGIAVYGARMTQEINNSNAVTGNLNYSYGLAVVTTFMSLAAVVLTVLDMRASPEA